MRRGDVDVPLLPDLPDLPDGDPARHLPLNNARESLAEPNHHGSTACVLFNFLNTGVFRRFDARLITPVKLVLAIFLSCRMGLKSQVQRRKAMISLHSTLSLAGKAEPNN